MNEQRGAPGLTADDKWRHVREVLSKRTPDSVLVVNRYGMGINPHATGKAVTVLMRKQDDPNHAQVDLDLDALSILWNTADELVGGCRRPGPRAAAGGGAAGDTPAHRGCRWVRCSSPERPHARNGGTAGDPRGTGDCPHGTRPD